MDRNLWAKKVSEWEFNNVNLDELWYYYQWWNNYGFSNNPNDSIKTTNVKVDASKYGPNNYYSNNVYWLYNWTWDSSNNKNFLSLDKLYGKENLCKFYDFVHLL